MCISDPKETCSCRDYGLSRPVDMSTVQLPYRAYGEPAAKTRPALSELLLDRMLLFTAKQGMGNKLNRESKT